MLKTLRQIASIGIVSEPPPQADESLRLRDGLQDGIRAGVMGTPAIFINGTLLSGAQSESVFVQAIESELANLEKNIIKVPRDLERTFL